MRQAVVKLGGSTAYDPLLRSWTQALAAARLSLVVVPGGGPFADQVRTAQTRIGFSDAAAHRMAILAMDQFAHLIAEGSERLVTAGSLGEIAAASAAGRVPVWLPSRMALDAPDIAASWDITSDSLAAWLAGRLGADALLLIKQTRNFSAGDDIDTLAQRGIVDPGLPSMLPKSVDFCLAGPDHVFEARRLLSSGRLPGIGIGRAAPARRSG